MNFICCENGMQNNMFLRQFCIGENITFHKHFASSKMPCKFENLQYHFACLKTQGNFSHFDWEFTWGKMIAKISHFAHCKIVVQISHFTIWKMWSFAIRICLRQKVSFYKRIYNLENSSKMRCFPKCEINHALRVLLSSARDWFHILENISFSNL